MDSPVIIAGNFDISAEQKEQFDSLGKLYVEWNDKINVISRDY